MATPTAPSRTGRSTALRAALVLAVSAAMAAPAGAWATAGRPRTTRDAAISGLGRAAALLGGGAAPAVLDGTGAVPSDGRSSAPGGSVMSSKGTAGSSQGNQTSAQQLLTAHDGKFWNGSQEVVLRGFNYRAGMGSENELGMMEGWGANFARVRIMWSSLEPIGPIKLGNSWLHTYLPTYIAQIKAQVQANWRHGIWSMLDSSPCLEDDNCGYFPHPDWLYTAPYNSHGVTYPKTPEGKLLADTQYWTDPLRQQFERDMWTNLVTQVDGLQGIMGYEIRNEPGKGYLDNSHDTTQTILDWQLWVARAIRNIDPSHIIVFTTRAGYGPGLEHADLSGWANLQGSPRGNVAFDLHDYFGARWGDGISENPNAPDWTETVAILFDHVLDDNAGPYIGNTLSHERFVKQAVNRLHGIPVVVGEFGDVHKDPGIKLYFGTLMAALTDLNVSWAGNLGGPYGIVDENDHLYPWGQIVVDAL
jgi:hypothetical protein